MTAEDKDPVYEFGVLVSVIDDGLSRIEDAMLEIASVMREYAIKTQ